MAYYTFDQEIDPETGLPVLPEGYYWKVGRSTLTPAYPLNIKLCRRGKLFAILSHHVSAGETLDDQRGLVIQGACYAAWKWRATGGPNGNGELSLRSLVGSYPPKKIGW